MKKERRETLHDQSWNRLANLPLDVDSDFLRRTRSNVCKIDGAQLSLLCSLELPMCRFLFCQSCEFSFPMTVETDEVIVEHGAAICSKQTCE